MPVCFASCEESDKEVQPPASPCDGRGCGAETGDVLDGGPTGSDVAGQLLNRWCKAAVCRERSAAGLPFTSPPQAGIWRHRVRAGGQPPAAGTG